jgi:CRISPR/Cas system-associated exonuclease Cas4 (RecB family)
MFKKASLRVCEHEPDCLSSREMQTVEDSIVAVVERIAGGFFDPDPKSSFECGRCSFDFVCSPEGEEAGEDG